MDAFLVSANLNPGTDTSTSAHWDHAIILTGFDLRSGNVRSVTGQWSSPFIRRKHYCISDYPRAFFQGLFLDTLVYRFYDAKIQNEITSRG